MQVFTTSQSLPHDSLPNIYYVKQQRLPFHDGNVGAVSWGTFVALYGNLYALKIAS